MILLGQFSAVIIGILFVSIVVSIIFQRTIFTTSVIFIGIWIFVLLAHYYQVAFRGYDNTSFGSYEVLTKGILGVSVGCLVMQILLGRTHAKADRVSEHFSTLPAFIDRFYFPVFLITMFLGLLAFFVEGGGLNFSFENFRDVRRSFVEKGAGITIQLAKYSAILCSVTAIFLALSDRVEGRVSFARLALLCLAVVPLTLSKGSRLEVVLVALHYFSTAILLLSMQIRSDELKSIWRSYLRRIRARGLLIIVLLGVFFSSVGMIRSANTRLFENVGGGVDMFLYPIANYLSGSVYSVGPLSSWIDDTIGASFGAVYFEVFHKLIQPLGFGYFDSKSMVRLDYDEIGWIAFTPGTFVRGLVADFGLEALPFVGFCIGALSTLVVLRFKSTSIIWITCGTLVFYDLLYSFQTIGLFSVANLYKLLIAAVFAHMFQVDRRRKMPAARRIAPI